MPSVGVACTVLIAAIAMLVTARSAVARDDDVTLREDVERRMVAVRVLDAAMNDVIAYGSGLIVGERDGEFFITTARHVISPPNLKPEEYFIEVRFFRRDEWIRLKQPPLASASRDLAVLIAPVKYSPYEPQTLESTLPVAAVDAQTRLKDVTIFGVDVENKREMRQGAGAIANVDGEKIIFDAADVQPGWSGGVVLNEVGLVGIIVTEGSGRKGHQALAFAALLDELKTMNIPLQVRSEPLLAALAAAQKNGLALGMFVWDQSSAQKASGEWAAIRLTSQDGLRFTGECLSLRGGGAACTLEPRGSEIVATLPARLLWRVAQNEPPTRTFSSTSDCSARGMLALKCADAGFIAYLAVPTARCELLGSAILRTAAGNDWTRISLPPDVMQAFQIQSATSEMVFDGVRPSFPLNLPRPGAMWPLTIDRADEATMRMKIRVGDGAIRMRDRDKAAYDSLRVLLKDADGRNELSSKRIRSEGERTSNWVVKVPQRFSLWFEGDNSTRTVPIVMEAAVVEYE